MSTQGGLAQRVVRSSLGPEQAASVSSFLPLQAVADALGVPDRGRQLVEEQRRRLQAAADSARGRGSLRVACIQWPSPLMACGAWVPELVKVGRCSSGCCSSLWPPSAVHCMQPAACFRCRRHSRARVGTAAAPFTIPCHPPARPQMTGSEDVVGSVRQAEVISEERLRGLRVDVLIFALCGLDLQRSAQAARAAMRRLAGAWPAGARVAVVDGEHVFSRPGPLLCASMEALVEVLHPEAQPYGHEGRLWQWLPADAAPAPA